MTSIRNKLCDHAGMTIAEKAPETFKYKAIEAELGAWFSVFQNTSDLSASVLYSMDLALQFVAYDV